MAKDFAGPINVEFLNGYLLHCMRAIYDERGRTGSGYDDFYAARVLKSHRPISDYDVWTADYLSERWPGFRVVDVGTGIGTLDILLAARGTQVGGVEVNNRRAMAARHLRSELSKTWPVIADRWEIIEGRFPEATEGTVWESKQAVLVFTNVGSSWDEALNTKVIDRMTRFKHVLLDLVRWGVRRDDERERDTLFRRMAERATYAERVPADKLGGFDFAHFEY